MSFRLEFRPRLPILALAALAACASPDPVPPPQVIEEPVPVVQVPTVAALAAIAAEDAKGGLNAMDAWTDDYRQDAAFWLLYGRTSATLFGELEAGGRLSPGLASDLLDDIDAAYGRVVALGAADADVQLERATWRRTAGDTQGAWASAEAALDLLDAGDALLPEARVAAAQHGVQAVAEAVQAGAPVPAAARRAGEQLRRCLDAGIAGAALPLSDLCAWQGQTDDAISAAAAGLALTPGDQALYGRLQNLGSSDRNRQVATLEQLRADRPDSAEALWYLGEARYWQGRAARDAADYLKAMECWGRAEECFLQTQALRADYAATCREWLHLVRTQRGWTLRDEGRTSEAAATFAAALQADPESLEPESTPQSLRLGIDAVIADFYRSGDLEQARRLLRRACAVDDSDSAWTNNLGLFCRDLGVAASLAGKGEAAQAYFEESWDAYTRAVEVSPDDPRLVNDRALIAVYYLDRDWDLAEQELHRAIELGTAGMAEWGEDVPEEERHAAEEAVGDAWENLAYLELIRRERIGDSPTYLVNAVKYYPYGERSGVERLNRALAALREANQ